MTYESWRIAFQDSEQAAIAAYNDLDRTHQELERWKTMAQRNNPSGCCCQIDENNGDPKIIEPCAFHAEWRDSALESLRGKLRRKHEWGTF